MISYTLKKDAKVMGEKHPDFGFSYWTEVEEIDLPVMFSTHEMNFTVGQGIVAESQEKKTSAKGNDYMRLKKVKKVDSGSQGSSPSSAPTIKAETHPPAAESGFTEADRAMLQKILEYVEPIDKVVPLDDGEKIDLDGIPF